MKFYRKIHKPFTYKDLIFDAIKSTPDGRATINMILDYARSRFPSIFQDSTLPTWKSNIRQTMSRCDIFKKEAARRGRERFWSIDEEKSQLAVLMECLDTPAGFQGLGGSTENICNRRDMEDLFSCVGSDGLRAKPCAAGCSCCDCAGRLTLPQTRIQYNEYALTANGKYNESGYWHSGEFRESDTGDEFTDKLWFHTTRYSSDDELP